MKIKRIVYIVLGSICLALGTVGIFLPLLPTVPLYLVTIICYAKSSKKLYRWFRSTKIYEKHLHAYARGKGMTKNTKIKVIAMVTACMLISCILVDVLIARVSMTIVWIGLMIYFIFGVKTLESYDIK